MPTTYKILGQKNPLAVTADTLYAVTAPVTATVVSTITVCNLAAADATYRIAIRKANAGLTAMQYIAYDATIAGNDTVALTLGITLAVTDVITVYASTVNVSFNAFGSEIS